MAVVSHRCLDQTIYTLNALVLAMILTSGLFPAALVLLSNAANIANILNLVSYLRNEMHMDVARASTMASNFFAALQMFSIPAAFLADSYIRRFYTVLIFGPIEILVQVATPFFSQKIYIRPILFTFKVHVG
jgi:hypothetical protein